MYREYLPPPPLVPLVERFWTIRSEVPLPATRWNRVLPDGCMDFIFDLGDLPATSGAPSHGLRSYVVGTMTRALVVGHVGRTDLLGVRFRPGGAMALAEGSADELTDRRIALEDVFPGATEVTARLADAPPSDRLAILASALEAARRRASARVGAGPAAGAGAPAGTVERRVRHAVALIRRRAGGIPVATLAREVNLSGRQLERLFARHVGASPREACAVARFQAAAAAVRADPSASLAQVAVLTGYHDQPHMTREFRRLAGTTPGAFRRERRVGSVQDDGDRNA